MTLNMSVSVIIYLKKQQDSFTNLVLNKLNYLMLHMLHHCNAYNILDSQKILKHATHDYFHLPQI